MLASALATGVSASESDAEAALPAEERRHAAFAAQWSQFLVDSLDAKDERQRLVAAIQVLDGGSVARAGRDGRAAGVPALAELAKAVTVRDAVRNGTRDPATLALAAATCRQDSHDPCDRLGLLERWVAVDTGNAAAWLALANELASKDSGRAQQLFERAVAAPSFSDSVWEETLRALYGAFRQEHPEGAGDLALIRAMGLASAYSIGGAGSFAWRQCGDSGVQDDARRADCRRLAETMARSARTVLTLKSAHALGERAGVAADLLARWKADIDLNMEAPRRLPLVPTAQARDAVHQWGDDLVSVGEIEAQRRLMRRPPPDLDRWRPLLSAVTAILAREQDGLKARLATIDALGRDGDPLAVLLARGIDKPLSRRLPPMPAAKAASLGDAILRSREPTLLSLAALRCTRRENICDPAAVARRWTELETDNAAAWLFLAAMQLEANDPMAARASVLRASGQPRYRGYAHQRLRAADERLRAVAPQARVGEAFDIAATLAQPRSVFGTRALERFCTGDADVEMRSACAALARRVYDDAGTVPELEVALRAWRGIGDLEAGRRALATQRLALGAQALGFNAFGWRHSVHGDGSLDAAAAQVIAQAVLAHGELGAIRALIDRTQP